MLLTSMLAFPFTQVVADDSAVAKKNEEAGKVTPAEDADLKDLKHAIQPMLWKVEGNGLKKPSYLFGSVHVSDARVINLHPLAEAAYQQADTLSTEVKLDMMSQIASMNLMLRKEGALKDDIGEELNNKLAAELKNAPLGLNVKALQSFKTWAVILTVSMLEEQAKEGDALDLVMWKRAAKDKKKRWALETHQEQMGGFDKLTKDEQTKLLKGTLENLAELRKTGESSITPLVNMYLRGDGDKIVETQLAEIEKDEEYKEVTKKFMKLLLDDRNKRMANTIVTKLKAEPEHSHFMVAGTLHYVGKGNVGELLQKLGYKVTRIVAEK